MLSVQLTLFQCLHSIDGEKIVRSLAQILVPDTLQPQFLFQMHASLILVLDAVWLGSLSQTCSALSLFECSRTLSLCPRHSLNLPVLILVTVQTHLKSIWPCLSLACFYSRCSQAISVPDAVWPHLMHKMIFIDLLSELFCLVA